MFLKLSLLFLSFLIIPQFFSQQNQLVGTWKIMDEDDDIEMYFIFKEDSTLIMIQDQDTLGNYQPDKSDETVKIYYSTDNSKNPNWLDFTFYNTENDAQKYVMHGIYEINNEGILYFCLGKEEDIDENQPQQLINHSTYHESYDEGDCGFLIKITD